MTRLFKQTILLGLVLFLLSIFSCWTIYDAYGQEWVTANQSTVAWDAVTTLSNGDPIPEDNTVEYIIYLANAVTDPDKANPVRIGIDNITEFTITLNAEGQYFVGLQALRLLSDGDVVGESVIVWSDDPAIVAEGQTFGLRYFLPPVAPSGLRH